MSWGAAIGGAAKIAGAAGLSAGAAALSYKEQKKLLEKQQAFEREKALHAHQWEVSDLKAAGLNPVLSAGGPGASMGSPTAPSTAAPDMAGAALSAAEKKLQKDRLEAEKVGIEAGVKQAEASAKQAEATARKAEAEAILTENETAASAGRLKAEKEYNDSTIGQTLHKIGQGAKDVGAITQPIGNIVGGAMIYRGLKGIKQAMSAGAAAANTTRTAIPTGRLITGDRGFRQKLQIHKGPNGQEYIKLSPTERGFMRYQ